MILCDDSNKMQLLRRDNKIVKDIMSCINYDVNSTDGGIQMKQSKVPEIAKFDDIVSELLRRGVVVLTHRPTRWGYTVDAVIPSAKVVVLKMPDLTRQTKEAMSMFQDLTSRLGSDGYRVLIVPKTSMNEEQIRAFCDRISVEPSPAAA